MGGKKSFETGTSTGNSRTVSPKAKRALENVSDEQWKTLILELGLYASSVSRSLNWRTGSTSDLPGGETVDSIVSQAILTIYEGDREWDPEKNPDLGNYLRDVIDSLLNHLATGVDNRRIERIVKDKYASQREIGEISLLAQKHPSPEATVLEKERAETADRAIQLLMEECRGDELVLSIIKTLRDEEESIKLLLSQGILVYP